MRAHPLSARSRGEAHTIGEGGSTVDGTATRDASLATEPSQSVAAAAKSLVNFFRDVCPELLPKKMRGRFTNVDETNDQSNIIFGQQKLNMDIET